MTPDEFIALARGVVGLSYDGETHDDYLELVAPSDVEPDQARREEIGKMSGCELVARGLLRRAGVVHELLEQPYRTSKAGEDLEKIARDGGAWLPADAPIPVPSIVIIERPEHAAIVVGKNSNVLETVNGGERDATKQETIALVERHAFYKALDGRPIYGAICVAKILSA